MRRLIASLVCAFAIAALGLSGLETPARAAPGARSSAGKKKRPRSDSSAARRTKDAKVKKAKDKQRGFEF